ncbi:MAG: hypothetical protein IPK79_10840 [Vampirovibrionales bacterium]|nr:hypothetical protein [Vampirovibrionales bacterium]
MPFKPMKLRDYLRWIGQYGWSLKKSGVDWSLINAEGRRVILNIIVTHPGREVIPASVKRTSQALEAEGFSQD